MSTDMTLYEIKNMALEVAMDEEMTDCQKEMMQIAIQQELKNKSDGIIAFTKRAEALIEAMKKEEERLKESRKAKEKKLESFKNYVKDCMMQMNLRLIETPLGEMKIAKNPMSVEIIDEQAIPQEFIKTKTETSIDKKGMIDHFKETGELVNGVKFHDDNYSLRIK